MTINVVDSHHKVLLAWAKLRGQTSSAPRLITLDHHTDTSTPFRRHLKKKYNLNQNSSDFSRLQAEYLGRVDCNHLESVIEAIEKLNNDEHIVAAIKTDVISSAFVIAHNAANTDFEVYKAHKIACRTVTSNDSVLESITLDKNIFEFDKILHENGEDQLLADPYILDIDLDYFNTFRSIEPENSETFLKLIRQAALVTIATEPDYVQSCALDKGLTSGFLLQSLRERFLKS